MLSRADAIMEEHPDSALAILQTIDRRHISDRDLPYYALLLTQAQVKTDIHLDSDSLISVAYGKYAGSWRGDKGIRSEFYMGEVFFNQDKPREAMRHYLSSYEESKRLGNHYWRAKSAERIADLFFNAYNYEDATEYRKEAIQHYGLCGNPTNQRYAVADLATVYINASRYDEAIILLDSVYAVVLKEEPENQLLQNYIRRARVDAMVSLGRIHELNVEDITLLEPSSSSNLSFDNNILKLQAGNISDSNGGSDELMRAIRTSAHSDEEKALPSHCMHAMNILGANRTSILNWSWWIHCFSTRMPWLRTSFSSP